MDAIIRINLISNLIIFIFLKFLFERLNTNSSISANFDFRMLPPIFMKTWAATKKLYTSETVTQLLSGSLPKGRLTRVTLRLKARLELFTLPSYEGQSISNASYFFFSFTFQENSNPITQIKNHNIDD